MTIVLLLVIAYLLISFTAVTDKFILTKALLQPVVYAFFISTIGLAALILLPFGFSLPPVATWGSSLVAGGCYTLAIFFLYHALQRGEASRVFATAGSLGAVLTFVFSSFVLNDQLSSTELIAFGLLVIGGLVISLERQSSASGRAGLLYAVLTALMFGISYTAAKAAYNQQGFVTGFVMIRVFAFLAILPFLASAANRRFISQSLHARSPIRRRSFQLALAAGQVTSGIGFLILNYVISLTNAALALAAQGLQYAFLFIATVFLSKQFPNILRENITRPVIVQKVAAIGLISLGLIILAMNGQ